mgnify:CR=1 FL=1
MTDKNTKEFNVEVVKIIMLLGKLCMQNYNIDPRTVDTKTEHLMIEALSGLQSLLCQLLEISHEDQREGMKRLDEDFTSTFNQVMSTVNGLPN